MQKSIHFNDGDPDLVNGVPVIGPESRMSSVVEYAVANVFGVRVSDLRMATRGQARIALARQAAMYLVHVNLGFSMTETGHLFERDRTTVAHGCHRIENLRDDPVFDRALGLLERAFGFMVRSQNRREMSG